MLNNRNWSNVSLGEIAKIERTALVPQLIKTGTTYVGLENIDSDGKFVNVRTVESGDIASAKYTFNSNHILYGKLRPYLKKIARPTFDGVCSTDILPILPSGNVDRGFLFHYLRQQQIIDLATARSAGANLPRISPAILAEFPLPLPPLAEQRRIAEILDRADALREKRRKSIAMLDTLVQSVFLEMFGDPVTNPKGWPQVIFDDVCKTRLGKMLDEKKQTGFNRRPYLRNANVQWDRLDLSSVYEMDFEISERETFRLHRGDLLICEGGEIGRSAIWRDEIPECYYQKALHRGRPDSSKAVSEYLLYMMYFFVKNGGLKDYVTSATIAHLTGEKLKSITIPLPPIQLQHQFQVLLESIRKLKSRLEYCVEKYEELFLSLQHNAFNGSLSLNKLLNTNHDFIDVKHNIGK